MVGYDSVVAAMKNRGELNVAQVYDVVLLIGSQLGWVYVAMLNSDLQINLVSGGDALGMWALLVRKTCLSESWGLQLTHESDEDELIVCKASPRGSLFCR
jgi:hypothetical protein